MNNGANVTLKPPIEIGCRYSNGADQQRLPLSLELKGRGCGGLLYLRGVGLFFVLLAWRTGCGATTQHNMVRVKK